MDNANNKPRIDALQGGAFTVADIIAALQNALDFARIQTIASPVTLSAAMQYIYSRTASDRPFFFAGGFLSWDSGTWASGETIAISVEMTVDGTNWEEMWSEQLVAASDPLTRPIPHLIDANGMKMPMGFWVGANCGIRVGIQQDAEHDGFHVISHNFVDGVPSN